MGVVLDVVHLLNDYGIFEAFPDIRTAGNEEKQNKIFHTNISSEGVKITMPREILGINFITPALSKALR